ncbi:MAG: hypothetical protein WCV82_01630 [Candidatus Paceibacterota bacterium]
MRNNSNKAIVVIVLIIVVVAGIVWFGGRSDKGSDTDTVANPLDQVTNGSNAVLPVSETTQVSSSLSQYQNAELGISVKYPSSWEKEELSSGAHFIMPIDQSQVSTVAKIEADVTVTFGKCAFPPVTTIDDRSVVTVGAISFNMIAISNSVQGRSYFNRMYSYEKGGLCYFFAFSYIALSPDSKGLTGSNLTQATNNNKAIKTAADTAFTAMVKSFGLVAPPQGKDETQAPAVKK